MTADPNSVRTIFSGKLVEANCMHMSLRDIQFFLLLGAALNPLGERFKKKLYSL